MIEWTAACSPGGNNGPSFPPGLFAEDVCEDGRRDESGGQPDEMHQPRKPPRPSPTTVWRIKTLLLLPRYHSGFSSVQRIKQLWDAAVSSSEEMKFSENVCFLTDYSYLQSCAIFCAIPLFVVYNTEEENTNMLHCIALCFTSAVC